MDLLVASCGRRSRFTCSIKSCRPPRLADHHQPVIHAGPGPWARRRFRRGLVRRGRRPRRSTRFGFRRRCGLLAFPGDGGDFPKQRGVDEQQVAPARAIPPALQGQQRWQRRAPGRRFAGRMKIGCATWWRADLGSPSPTAAGCRGRAMKACAAVPYYHSRSLFYSAGRPQGSPMATRSGATSSVGPSGMPLCLC